MKPRNVPFALLGLSALAISSVARADEPTDPAQPAPSSTPAAEESPSLWSPSADPDPTSPPPPYENDGRRRYGSPDPSAARIPYKEGKPAPPGYTIESVPRSGMVIGGAVIAGGLHLISMISAIALDQEADEVITDDQGGSRTDPEFDNRYTPLFIPIAGPFVTIKTASSTGTGMAILVMNGVAQVTGLSLVIAGLAAPKKVLVKDEPVTMGVAPLFVDGGGGMAIEGKF
jgi:hypothetical protein